MAHEKTKLGLDENVEGALAYLLGIITGILFLLLEPKNKFVRFHALQSIFLFGGLFVLSIIASFIPVIPLNALISLLSLILWIFMMVKAYQGEMYKLPVVGDLAEKYV
ncbi:MAG: hypothetical protein GXN99_00625 [Candidatus Nanohaloarchaeota archaeon]|nr:hypothetical protein [Candidatus Nanohaloarchaeota archaeon]